MNVIEMNRKAAGLLEKWDPFKIGEEQYAAETAAVVTALQTIDHPIELAKKIQEVYKFSFEQWIPIEKCMEISYKLIAVKFEAKCVI